MKVPSPSVNKSFSTGSVKGKVSALYKDLPNIENPNPMTKLS